MVVEVLGGWSTEDISKGTSTLQLEPGLNSGSTRVARVRTELSFDES